METETQLSYESGIFGKAEVRFGGKILVQVIEYKNPDVKGIALCEFYQKGEVGENNPSPLYHNPQVFLLFDNMKSVEILENALMTVRENLKRQQEKKALAVSVPEKNPLFSRKVTELGLSVRVLGILRTNDINTLGELIRLRRKGFLRLRNAGLISVRQVDEKLQSLGLSWEMDV